MPYGGGRRLFPRPGPGWGKPGLNSPPDGQSLDCAKDCVGMHVAKFSRSKGFCYGALDYHGCEIQVAESFTRSHKSLSGTIRRAAAEQIRQRFPLDRHLIFQTCDGIIARRQSSSFYCGKPISERPKGIGLLFHRIDDQNGFGEGNLFTLGAKRGWFFGRLAHH